MGILLPPTILMGLTLPLLARALTRIKEDSARDLGALYAWNTCGAAIGAILTGFILIAFFGIYTTLLIAASINMIIGVMAVILSRSRRAARAPSGMAGLSPVPLLSPALSGKADPVSSSVAVPSILRAPIFWAFAVSGFASLAGEVVWVRIFSPYLENSTYAFALILFIFLIGIAAGGWAGRRVAARTSYSLLGFGVCQLLAGVCTATGLILLFVFVQYYYGVLPEMAMLITRPWIIPEMSVSIAFILIPSTFFMGAGFPFIAQWAGSEFARLGERTGKLYAANTIGAIFGALAGGFVLLPALGTRDGLVFITFLYILNGGVLIYLCRKSLAYRPRTVWVLAILLLALIAALRTIPNPGLFAITNAHKGINVLAFREDPDVNVTLMGESRGRQDYALFINLRRVSGSSLRLTPWMVHLPMMLHKGPAAPSRVLNIGLGVGHTFSVALAHYSDLKIDVVELVPAVVDLFREFSPNGKKAMENPRGRVIIADGRNYLLSAKEPYDIVLIDPTPPLYGTGAVNLYTADFFKIVKERLAPGGILFLRIPVSADDRSVKLLLRTAIEVFPNVSLWMPPYARKGVSVAGYSVIAGSDDNTISAGELAEKVRELSTLNDDWKKLLLKTQPILVGKGPEVLAGDLDDFRVVTDDRPYLEFPLFNR
jgi:spermidine synthase